MKVKDGRHERRGVAHFKVSGKGGKTRYVPLHPAAGTLIVEYLEAAGDATDEAGPLFRALHRNRADTDARGITPDAVYKLVRGYFQARVDHQRDHLGLWPQPLCYLDRGFTVTPSCAT